MKSAVESEYSASKSSHSRDQSAASAAGPKVISPSGQPAASYAQSPRPRISSATPSRPRGGPAPRLTVGPKRPSVSSTARSDTQARRKDVTAAIKHWTEYYRPGASQGVGGRPPQPGQPRKPHQRDYSTARLLELIMEWRKFNKMAEVEGILTAFLNTFPQRAEYWMYEQLAVARKMNGAPQSEVKDALYRATALAWKRDDPNGWLSAADMLILNKYYDLIAPPNAQSNPTQPPIGVVDLLKRTHEKVPRRGEPLALAVKLAGRRKDPALMTWAMDRLMTVGWVNMDEEVRTTVRQEVTTLADSLRADGKDKEADALEDRLAEDSIRDLWVRLTWKGTADLDLVVKEPMGATVNYRNPWTVFGGTLVKNGFGRHAEEVYTCPQGFDGTYTIGIDVVANDPKDPATDVTLLVLTHEGTPRERKQTYHLDLKKLKPIAVTLKGGRRKDLLPYLPPPPDLTQFLKPRSKGPAAATTARKGPATPRTPQTAPGSSGTRAGGAGTTTGRPVVRPENAPGSRTTRPSPGPR